MKPCILATGGAGYIGSHVATQLLEAGYRVVILDNFENSDPDVVDRIEAISGARVRLVEGDVRHQATVERVLRVHQIDAVIHLAGKKAVGDSVADPLLYFNDNLNGAMSLLRAMNAAGVMRLAFSSSATVYGTPRSLPIAETAETGATSPYGRTKLMIEEIIDDCVASIAQFRAISLRYFNPVGAHATGLIGESPRGRPNNLFPYVVQTATGDLPFVRVFGGDYPTADGTGLRDYIHVVDLARGHVAAVDLLLADPADRSQHRRINLGTGLGHTVLQVISAMSKASGQRIPYKIVHRRPGDVAASVADPSLAHTLLGWRAEHGLDRMCLDQWRFASQGRSGPDLLPSVLASVPAGSRADRGHHGESQPSDRAHH